MARSTGCDRSPSGPAEPSAASSRRILNTDSSPVSSKIHQRSAFQPASRRLEPTLETRIAARSAEDLQIR